MNILVVEDDDRIVEFLRPGLVAEGLRVEVVRDGEAGLAAGQNGGFDVILRDLMLPKLDGREVCRRLRAEQNNTPILMLTALDTTEDIVRGLHFGADDYLTKPFAFDELVARIETLSRRGGAGEVMLRTLQVADLEFDRDALVVKRAGRAIELTSLEYALLEFLMAEAGKVVSRARILDNVWGTSNDPLTNIVDVYIRRLREKIDEGFDRPLIKTIRGRGYRLSDS